MWADVYLPKTESDLAPSKTRIVKVKNWLNEALYGYPEDAPAQMKENKALAEKIRKYRVSDYHKRLKERLELRLLADITSHWACGSWKDHYNTSFGKGYGD